MLGVLLAITFAAASRSGPPLSFAPPKVVASPSPTLPSTTVPSTGAATTARSRTVDPRASVLKIVGSGCGGEVSGTGFVVGAGVVATNAHVVAGISDLRVDPDDQDLAAKVIAFDPAADLALLSVPGLDASPLTLAEAPVVVGEGVTSLGYAGGGPLQNEAGTVSERGEFQVSDIWLSSYSARELLETNLAVRGGDSGGPVLNADNQVVGVIFGGSSRRRRAGSVAFADDVTELTQFLAERPHAEGTDRCSDGRIDIQ